MNFNILVYLILWMIIPVPVTSAANFKRVELDPRQSLCDTDTLGIHFRHGDWTSSWSAKIQSRPQHIVQLDQFDFGADFIENGEVFRRLVSLAAAGDVLVGNSDLQVDLLGVPVLLPSGVSLNGMGMRIYSSRPTRALLLIDSNDSFQEIINTVFDGLGNDKYGALVAKAVDGVRIYDNVFVNTGKTAIVIESTREKSSRNIQIESNYISNPRQGAAHLILVKSKPFGKFVDCIAVEGNQVFGSESVADVRSDYSSENDSSADQIVFQGVRNFLLKGNYSAWSGSAGYTVARLSRNGVVVNNVADVSFEPGFNIGSGFSAVYLTDVRDIEVGSTISIGKAKMKVGVILQDTHLNTGWLRGGISKNWVKVGDKVSNSLFDTVLVKAVLQSAEEILIEGNHSYDSGIQGNKGKPYGAFNVIRSTGLRFRENHDGNPKRLGKTNRLLSLSAAKAEINPEYHSRLLQSGRLFLAGPEAEVLNGAAVPIFNE